MRAIPGSKAFARVALLAVLAAANASAEAGDESDWGDYQPPAQFTKTAVAPTTSEGGFAGSDRARFDEKLRSNVLDQVCRAIKLDQNFNFGPGDFSGSGVGVTRYLAARPDNKLSLVEGFGLRASWSRDITKDFDGDVGGPSAGLHLSGAIDGRSLVITPLESVNTCSELDRLVRKPKIVLPFSARHISEMEVGELWRVPFTLSYTQSVGVPDALSDKTVVTLSFGRTESGAASMTLFRLAPDKVRFRFHIEHVVIKFANAGVTQSIPAVAFAADASNILLRLLERQVARQLSRYTSAWLTGGIARSDGKRIIIEFVADPRDPAQAEALSQALKGDFIEMNRLAWRMSLLQINDDSAREAYDRVSAGHALRLGAPTYAAISQSKAKTRSFSMNLPLLVQYNASSLFGDDKVSVLNGGVGEFRYYRADRSRSAEYINLPWVGSIVKGSSQRSAETVTFAEPGGAHSEPIMVYIHNQGFLRATASNVRHSVQELNDIMRLAGSQRGSPSSRMVLPIDALAPAPPPSPVTPTPEGETSSSQESGDRKGWLSMTLVLNQKAVREAIAAGAEQVLKAFPLTVGADNRDLADWLAAHGRFEKGTLTYDESAARERFAPPSGSEERDRAFDLYTLSRQVAGLVVDMAAARGARTNVDRARAVSEMMSGRAESGLSHEQVLKVLVQFVDPLDVTGDFISTVKSMARKGGDFNAHLTLKKDRLEVPLLRAAGETKARFAQPTILQD